MKDRLLVAALAAIMIGGSAPAHADFDQDFAAAVNRINDAVRRATDRMRGQPPPERDFLCRIRANGPIGSQAAGAKDPMPLRISQPAADHVDIQGAAMPVGRGPVIHSAYEKRSASVEIRPICDSCATAPSVLLSYAESMSGLLSLNVFQTIVYGQGKDARFWLDLSSPQGIAAEFDVTPGASDRPGPNERIRLNISCGFVDR